MYIRHTRPTQRTLLQKLVASMLALAALLLFALLTGLFLLGRFNGPKQALSEMLGFQMEVFSHQIEDLCDDTASTGLLLTEEMDQLIGETLSDRGLSFDALSRDPEALTALQEAMIDPLRQMLLQSECSGAFVLLDTTVSPVSGGPSPSRSGLYLQKSASQSARPDLLLYRGIAQVGKAHGIMPHRKWRLEFSTDQLPALPLYTADQGRSPERAYQLTASFVLPGTSERVVLMTLPLTGSDGQFYGICGFELSQSHFQSRLAQSTLLPHLTCLVSVEENGVLLAPKGLSCGVSGGYYLPPGGDLTADDFGEGLTLLSGGTVPYVSLRTQLRLTPCNGPYTLSVMVPRADFDRNAARSALQFSLLLILLLFFTVTCCIYFSHRFLGPVLRGLDRLRSESGAEETPSGVQEIDDLFGFLAARDREHEAALKTLEAERNAAETRTQQVLTQYAQTQERYQSAQTEIARLAYSRTREVDPDEYQLFLDGIEKLTRTEREIFGYYLEGHTVKEILDIAGIKESTLRYHNRNIYGKLGVNSLKQLLRYAALMDHQPGEGSAKQ